MFPFPVDQTAVSVNLPLAVEVDDYHEFRYIEGYFRDIGLKVEVTEVGFYDGMYLGVVHLDTPEHDEIVKKMVEYIEILEVFD